MIIIFIATDLICEDYLLKIAKDGAIVKSNRHEMSQLRFLCLF